MEKVVVIGDRFRWSIPLLRHMLEGQDAAGVHDLVLRVVDIRLEVDGLKTIVMERDKGD